MIAVGVHDLVPERGWSFSRRLLNDYIMKESEKGGGGGRRGGGREGGRKNKEDVIQVSH